MKKIGKKVMLIALCAGVLTTTLLVGNGKLDTVSAKSRNNTILDGIFVEDIDLSGLTKEEATDSLNAFVEELKSKVITFSTVNDYYVAVTAGDLGIRWINDEIIDEIAGLGKEGNIVQRYKAVEDLKRGNMVYHMELDFDKEAIRSLLEEQCTEYDYDAVNASLKRVNGDFEYIDGKIGLHLNIDESQKEVYDYLTNGWDFQDASIDLIIDEMQPKGSRDELARVKDVLGSYTTSFTTSSTARCKNIENACGLINGATIYPGEEFSTLGMITPFSEANGYFPAGSYLNGRVVESLGGGICQVSTTLYNAVLLSELEVTERSNHSMIISYVEPSMDAAIAESSGKNFRFKNNTDVPIYIEGYTQNKRITFVIYGQETRDAGHKVRYESEVLETTPAGRDNIIMDSSQGIGFIDVQAAHIGYKARLWRIIEENGVEVSREVINKSTYKMSPKTATVGVKTSNPEYAARINNAIATGSIDVVRAEIAAIKNEMAIAQLQAQ